MNEVSCRAMGVILDALVSRGIPQEALIEGLPVSLDTLRDEAARIDWDLFVTLNERFEHLCGGPEQLAEIGRAHFRTESFAIFRRVASVLTSARDLYWMGTVWFGRRLFTIIEDRFEDLPDGRVRETLHIPPPYRDCPQLLRVFEGALAVVPSVLGQGEAKVEMQLEPRTAFYLITPPPPPRWRRSLRSLVPPLRAQGLIVELSAQQAELKQSNARLRAAHQTIIAQAKTLRRINEVGRTLARQTDLAKLSNALMTALRDDFPGWGFALWLEPRESESDLPLREEGACHGQPSRSHQLRTAGRMVGRLDVWEASDPPPRPDLIDELVPWIAMAVDNARSYALLRGVNRRLVERVEESQTRLQAVNYDLLEKIAQRNRSEAALRVSEQQLREAERLASVGTLAAGIAHEINNPVASILAAAQYAIQCRDDPDAQETALRALEDVAEEARRCGRIVKSVLQFSRNESTERWPADLNDVARGALRATWDYASRHEVRIAQGLSPHPCRAVVNPIEIQQVIVNLLRNAVEASTAGALVQLRTEPAGEWIRLRIEDTGSGIPDVHRSRLFEPFFTTRRGAGGTGLGLSMVHGIVTAHGGRIGVQSARGRGTIVQLELPSG